MPPILGTKNSDIEYSLFGDMSRNFTIDRITGMITVSHPVDFEEFDGPLKENVRTLLLTLRARDWGTPSLYTDVPLYIYVEDVNDNPPVFEETYYNVSLPEDVNGGVPILQV